jgi:hypothetical protein
MVTLHPHLHSLYRVFKWFFGHSCESCAPLLQAAAAVPSPGRADSSEEGEATSDPASLMRMQGPAAGDSDEDEVTSSFSPGGSRRLW